MNLTKIFLTFSFVNLFTFNAFAQPKTEFKFDFGSSKTAKGYIQVSTESAYSKEKGFGFMPNSKVESIIQN